MNETFVGRLTRENPELGMREIKALASENWPAEGRWGQADKRGRIAGIRIRAEDAMVPEHLR
jgi:hypothetical protein